MRYSAKYDTGMVALKNVNNFLVIWFYYAIGVTLQNQEILGIITMSSVTVKMFAM